MLLNTGAVHWCQMSEMHQSQLGGAQVCILWCPKGESPSDALLGALTNKGFKITLAQDAHAVFAAACACHGVAQRVVIVLDQRSRLRAVDRVLLSLERFAPTVICWAHQPGANPPMVPVVSPSRAKPVSRIEREAPTKRTAAKSGDRPAAPLRLVGQEEPREPLPDPKPGAGAPGGAPGEAKLAPGSVQVKLPPPGPLTARDVLDADELDALLAGEMGDRPTPGR